VALSPARGPDVPRVWEDAGVDVPAFRYYPDPVAAGSLWQAPGPVGYRL